MTAPMLPADGSYIEMTAYGETLPDVRVVHASGAVITLSLAQAQVPDQNTTVTLRWAAAPRGRYAQIGSVVAVDGNRVEIEFVGEPAVEQSRNFVRGGGGETIVLTHPDHGDAVGVVHDISERSVRAHFTDVAIGSDDEVTLRIQVGEEIVEFPAQVTKVSSMRQQIPVRGPLSVEMVAVFEMSDDRQAKVIRQYILRHQMLTRARGGRD
ncbi:MAG: hypothetical protein ABW046_22170 [Actinoplanes sp.]